jgi:hypothetical protein
MGEGVQIKADRGSRRAGEGCRDSTQFRHIGAPRQLQDESRNATTLRLIMVDENVVVMDGPGPFYFGRLLGPLELLPAKTVDAVAIQGQMEVNETGRRVVVRIPLADDDAMRLLQLLEAFQQDRKLPLPEN